jgi:acylphosphatase
MPSAANKKNHEKYLRAHAVIHGRVQGVFFRASTREEALRIGVGGWVRNLPDGSVEALFEGETLQVEEMLGWCHKGPSGARVSSVDIVFEPYKGEFKRFEIRYGY